jgi:hypothetical protein
VNRLDGKVYVPTTSIFSTSPLFPQLEFGEDYHDKGFQENATKVQIEKSRDPPDQQAYQS